MKFVAFSCVLALAFTQCAIDVVPPCDADIIDLPCIGENINGPCDGPIDVLRQQRGSVKGQFAKAGKHIKQGFKDIGVNTKKNLGKAYTNSRQHIAVTGKALKSGSRQISAITKSTLKTIGGHHNKKLQINYCN